MILAGEIVYAATSASQVTYTTDKNAEIKNVEDALNELYSKVSNISVTNETISGTGSVSYTFQDDYRAACVYVYDGYNSGSTWSTTCDNSREISSKNWSKDLGYSRYILLENISQGDILNASHSGNSYSVVLYIVFIK